MKPQRSVSIHHHCEQFILIHSDSFCCEQDYKWNGLVYSSCKPLGSKLRTQLGYSVNVDMCQSTTSLKPLTGEANTDDLVLVSSVEVGYVISGSE